MKKKKEKFFFRNQEIKVGKKNSKMKDNFVELSHFRLRRWNERAKEGPVGSRTEDGQTPFSGEAKSVFLRRLEVSTISE